MSKAKSTEETSHKPTEADQGHKTATGRAPQSAQSPANQRPQLARRERHEISPWASSNPFSFMRRFGEEMDRLFEDFGFGGLAASGLGNLSPSGWSPQIEVFEREGKLVVRADLPGMTKDEVKVDLEDNAITIHGERNREHEENRGGYYRSERSYGSFHRTIPLPDGVNGEDAKATFRDGVLEIEMEAPKRSSGRRLEIEEAPKQK